MEHPVTITLEQALDQSVQFMTRGQRRRFERRCTIPGYKEKYLEELRDNMLDDPRVAECCPMGIVAMSQDSFTAQTPFAIDGSKLKIFLDIIIEYGPKLLEVILLFVKAFSFSLLLPVMLATSAQAASPLSMDPLTLADEVSKDKEERSRIARVEESNRHILAQWGKLAGNCPGGICPLPAPSSNIQRVRYSVQPERVQPVVVPQVSSNYQRQWYNHDGMSLRQHAEVMHGHSTAGLTDSQVAALNDHDHNSWGHGGHPSRAAVRVAHGGYAYPVAGRVVRGGAVVVHGAVKVASAPVQYVRARQPVRTFLRNRQPVRRVVRSTARAVSSIRPLNIVRRVRGCY